MIKYLAILLCLIALPAGATTPTSSGVQQSGSVTAGHLPSWLGKNQIQDSGVAIGTTGVISGSVTGNAGTVSTINGLVTNGSNVTITGSGTSGSPYSISSSGGSGSPGGASGQIQYNNGGTFGGAATPQLRGVPSNQWSAVNVFGALNSVPFNNPSYSTNYGTDYGTLVTKQMGTAPTYNVFANYTGSDDGFNKDTCDIVEAKIVPNTIPQLQGTPLSLEYIESSEAAYGAGNYTAHLADTQTCLMGGVTWATVPQNYKTNAQTFTQTGTWANSTHYTNANANGVTSTTNASTLSGSVTTYGGPLYLWFLMHVSDGGAFSVVVDGGTAIPVNTQGQGATSDPTYGGLYYTYGAVRIPVAAAGSHTFTITVTSATSGSNTVTIEGFGTPPGKAYASTSPVFAFSGMIPNATYPAISTAFNSMLQNLARQLNVDGLQTLFADVATYYNVTTDVTGSGLNSTGQQHISDAFNGVLQASNNSMNALNPLDFGASCNSLYFPSSYQQVQSNAVTTIAGSPTISVANYRFQPGVATQFGGGDVGKRFCIGPGGGGQDEGPCSYIASVNTAANTANLGQNSITSNNSHYGVMGGYPTNPNDPSTAADDTIYMQNTMLAAAQGGGRVALPSNCMFHNLIPPQLGDGKTVSVTVSGNSPGFTYILGGLESTSGPVQPTIVNCGITGYSSDSPQCVQQTPSVQWSHIMFRAPTFPYTPFNISAACLGYSTNSYSGPGAQILTDHLFFFGCPIDIGIAYGYNHPVVFSASLTPIGTSLTSSMNVSSITSTNFTTADNWTNGNPDFLALGRTFNTATFTATGTGSPSTTINVTSISGAMGPGQQLYNASPSINGVQIAAFGTAIGTTGTYILASPVSISTSGVAGIVAYSTITKVDPTNNDTTGSGYVVSGAVTLGTTSLTSGAYSGGMELRDENSQHYVGGIGYNGDFSDSVIENSICTGTFMNGCWRIGPALASYGSGANRWIGGRAEEMANAAFTVDGGADQAGLILTGVDLQFNGGYTIRTLGSNPSVQWTAGYVYGGGHCTGYHGAVIRLGGTNPVVSVDGAGGERLDYGSGCTTDASTYLFSTEVGVTCNGMISVTGGALNPGSGSKLTNLYDWTNGACSNYKQDTAGWPKIDTTQTTINIGTTGYVGIGTTAALSPLSVIGLGTSAPIGTTTGALTVCIDSAGHLYGKTSCP